MKNKFDFYQFLEKNGYEKETIRKANGETYCTCYQKEVKENTWNCITIHENKTMSASSHLGNLEYKDQAQPEDEESAKEILKTIEIV